jgi:hypothetical protein
VGKAGGKSSRRLSIVGCSSHADLCRKPLCSFPLALEHLLNSIAIRNCIKKPDAKIIK